MIGALEISCSTPNPADGAIGVIRSVSPANSAYRNSVGEPSLYYFTVTLNVCVVVYFPSLAVSTAV